MDVRLPDGTVVTNVPEGTTQSDLIARVAKTRQSAEFQPTTPPAVRPQAQELSLMDKVLAKQPGFDQPLVDFAAGASGLMRGGANMISEGLGDKIWPKSVSTDSGYRTAGSFVDPVALAVGGVVGKALPYAPVLGKGVVEGVKAVGRNAMAGATAGGVIGGLSEEGDSVSGSAIGAGANVVLPPVLAGAGRVIGKGIDLVKGNLPAVKAAGILRDAAGNDLPAIEAALGTGGADVTAAQAASGVGNDAFNAVGELARTKRSQYFTDLLERQKQERLDAVRRLAGGATQTEAQQTTEASRKALNSITTPMRQTELEAANTAGTTGTRLQNEADRLGNTASSKVADVRRLEEAKRIAEGVAESGRPTLAEGVPSGMPRLSGRYSYADELAQVAESNSQHAADASLLFGDASRFAQSRANSLEAHGLRPLDTKSIVGGLVKKLNDPAIGVDPINAKVLKNVAQTIATWTQKGGGTIDASALYEIRKSAINSEVTKLLGTADPKANAKYAARLLNEIKPAIDDAIETAGGTGWRNYLKTFEDGMREINKQQMAGKALGVLEKTPNKFESLVAGNEPKMVEKVFKTEYDIKAAMGDKIKPMQKAAEELARDRGIAEGAKRGAGELTDILEKNISKFRLPNWINAKIAITNRGLIELESQVNKKTMEQIYKAMQSGDKALALLKTLPAKDRMPVVRALMTQQATPYAGAAITNVSEQQQ